MTLLWRLIQSRRNQTCLCSTLSRSHWSPGAAPPYHRVAQAADCCLSHDTGQSYSINQCLFSNTEHNTEHGRNKQYKTLERGLLKKLSYGFVYPYHLYLYMFPGHCMGCIVLWRLDTIGVWSTCNTPPSDSDTTRPCRRTDFSTNCWGISCSTASISTSD